MCWSETYSWHCVEKMFVSLLQGSRRLRKYQEAKFCSWVCWSCSTDTNLFSRLQADGVSSVMKLVRYDLTNFLRLNLSKLNARIMTGWYDQFFWENIRLLTVLCLRELKLSWPTVWLWLSGPAAPRFGVKNMRIDEETTFSIRVSWQPVDSRNVRHYRLNYISAKGDRAEETVRLFKESFNTSHWGAFSCTADHSTCWKALGYWSFCKRQTSANAGADSAVPSCWI